MVFGDVRRAIRRAGLCTSCWSQVLPKVQVSLPQELDTRTTAYDFMADVRTQLLRPAGAQDEQWCACIYRTTP